MKVRIIEFEDGKTARATGSIQIDVSNKRIIKTQVEELGRKEAEEFVEQPDKWEMKKEKGKFKIKKK